MKSWQIKLCPNLASDGRKREIMLELLPWYDPSHHMKNTQYYVLLQELLSWAAWWCFLKCFLKDLVLHLAYRTFKIPWKTFCWVCFTLTRPDHCCYYLPASPRINGSLRKLDVPYLHSRWLLIFKYNHTVMTKNDVGCCKFNKTLCGLRAWDLVGDASFSVTPSSTGSSSISLSLSKSRLLLFAWKAITPQGIVLYIFWLHGGLGTL